jgi:hypothetical protein
MKRMRRSVEGATINDVCLTIVGGAMYRYLEARGEAPEVPLTTHIPISTRELTKEGETAVNDDGNHFTHMHVSLHTDIGDPLQRLKAIAEETRHKKAIQRGAKIAVMQDIADQMPGALMGLALRFVTVINYQCTRFKRAALSVGSKSRTNDWGATSGKWCRHIPQSWQL